MFGETIEFKMRTFRFTSGGTQSSDPQQQTIECDLHLEPSATIVQEQAADCTCYTQEQCQAAQGRRIPENETVMTGITMYPDWEISIDLLMDVGPEDANSVPNRGSVMLFHFESGNPTGITPRPTGYSPPAYWGYMIPGVHERGLTH